MTTRIDQKFTALKAEGRTGLITYIMAGDPDYATSLEIMKALPQAGADIIELGMPFSDPMADGSVIQAAGLRSLRGGHNLEKTIRMADMFRREDKTTPLIVMGYYNPIYIYGVDRFLREAKAAGIDGLLVVDLPAEMDQELCIPALKAGISFIRLATPTTDDRRLPEVLRNTSGFVYYVSLTGVTGQTLTDFADVAQSVEKIKAHTVLPVAVGFGIKTRAQVAEIRAAADAVVVGTAIVAAIASELDSQEKIKGNPVAAAADLVRDLRSGL